MTRRALHSHIPTALLITAAVFVSGLSLIVATNAILAEAYHDRIMPGVSVAGVSIGGKTAAEARKTIETVIDRLGEERMPVRFETKTVTVPPESDQALSPDIAMVELISFNIDETMRRAWIIGRADQDFFTKNIAQLKALLSGGNVMIALSDNGVLPFLEKEFAEFNQPAKNPQIVFEDETPRLIPEETGTTLDFEKAHTQLMTNFTQGRISEVVIASRIDKPEISSSEVEPLMATLDSYLSFPETQLQYEKESWKLTTKLAKEWLGFAKDKKTVRLTLDIERIKVYLEKEVVPKVNKEPVEARLSMENGRVSVWQAGEDGLVVDLDSTAARIVAWPTEKLEKIEVTTMVMPGGSADATAQELGLTEIIGTGISKFSGSPVNRRHNIKIGANALHGLLIKPGEEFSLLKALGAIDASNGYRTELVIKGNKTIPEYGGGLCQIGTTIFRATFNSGLPVTQRRNHSYRVVYYEPAGTDATIYDPAPDYRFINDTGHHILIQARQEGDQLAFDLWGTKDGRKVEVGKPVIYNIVSPGPTKIIETPDLPEGQKKCTESAHAGADAYFDYKVTYPNGDLKDVRFNSHYVPWQAVCLVGAKKAPAGGVPPAPTGTVTPSVTPATE